MWIRMIRIKVSSSLYSGPDLEVVIVFADPYANRNGNISYRLLVSKTRSATDYRIICTMYNLNYVRSGIEEKRSEFFLTLYLCLLLLIPI